MKPVREKYQCDQCKCYFNWNENTSVWYGSYLQLEQEPGTINVFCSEKFGNEFKTAKEKGYL